MADATASDLRIAWTPLIMGLLTIGVILGGYASAGPPSPDGSTAWAAAGPSPAPAVVGSWTNVTAPPTPPAMAGSMMAYSHRANVFVLFGGWDGDVLNDTWVFDSATRTWSMVYTPHAPMGRGDGSFVYNARHDVFLLYGGWYEGPDETYVRLDDTWAFYLGNRTWVDLQPEVAPSARSDSAIAYDPSADVVVLFGGFDGTNYLGDVWAYAFSNNTWFPRPNSDAPSKRADGRMAYVEATDLFVLFGGNDYSGPNFTYHHLGDTWIYRWSLNTWASVDTTPSPEARDYPVLEYSPDAGAVLLIGGYGEGIALGDVWAFDVRSYAWMPVMTGVSPPPRFAAVGGYDTRAHVLVLFSGLGSDGLRADTWFLQYGEAPSQGTALPSLTVPQQGLTWVLFATLVAFVVAGTRPSSAEKNGARPGRAPPSAEAEGATDDRV